MDNRHMMRLDQPDKSPLRNDQSFRRPQQPYQLSSQKINDQYNEEEEYNRRRSEGLRKQLHASIRHKNDQQVKVLMDYRPENMHSSFDRQPEREQSASSHFTLGPQIVQQSHKPEELAPHLKEHLSNIQNDNSSLQRRLNLVVQELERVTRERDDLRSRLQYQTREQMELSRMINSEDDTDKVNKYMQDDLAYERDRNYKTKQQIKEIDLYRNELIRDLRKLQDIQEHTMNDNQDFNYQLQQKLGMLEDIEKEYYYTQEKIKATQVAIERSKLESNETYDEKCEYQRIIEQLQHERNDLLSKLDHLTKKYDECVREISIDRAEMESHNKQHSKLITSKIIFFQLDQMLKARMQQGFSEIRTYCTFDSKCHNKLSKLAKVLEKLGQFKLRITLKQWLQNTMKPIEMKIQSHLLTQQTQNIRLKQVMFKAWQKKYQDRVKSYDSKTKAILSLWSRAHRESLIEKKRSFVIWKETLQTFKLRRSRVKKLLWSLHFNKLSQALNLWINHNATVDSQVRLNLLKMNFSHKQYLTIMFHNFRLQTTESKRKRHNIMFHSLKYWKDHLQYQKFLMGANVAALNLRKQFNSSIMKACFDAIKQNKESEKYQKTYAILHELELPQIAQLTQSNEDFVYERKLQRLTQACEIVKTCMSKQLYTYIQHWKCVNEDYKEKLRTTIKDKIIKHYMSFIRTAFNHWKVNHNEVKVSMHQITVGDMQEEQTQLQNDVYTQERQISEQKELRDQCQKRHTLKCVTSFERRMKQLAMGRWRDKISDMNIKEDGAATVIRRLRLRFLRKAFDLYFSGVNFQKKTLKDEERCQQYDRLRDERLKTRVYHAWSLFKRDHQKAKDYWYRIYLRLDLSMKQSAMKKWKEVAQYRVERELQGVQDNKVEVIEKLNNQLGQMHLDETAQKSDISEKQTLMTQQARRIISNAFARYYYVNQTRGFEKWKEYVTFQKHKERLLRKFVDHWKRYQFYFVKSTFKNWMLNCDIEARKDQVRKEELKITDTEFQMELQTKAYNETSEKLSSDIEKNQQLQLMYTSRLAKSINLVVNKVDQNHYTTQRRYILQHWREYVKREVNFLRCTQNVIQKSIWQDAFTQIKEHARSNTRANLQSHVLNLFRQKFWKRTCGNAFSVWKSGAFAMVSQDLEEAEGQTQQAIEEHNNRKVEIKEHNAVRSERIIVTTHRKNVFQAWKNVTQFLKLQNAKNDYCQQEVEYFWRRNALRKWQARKQATKGARKRYSQLKEKVKRIRLRCLFNAIRDQYLNTASLCNRLANLGHVMDLQMLKSSFNSMASYSRAKNFVFDKRKENSTTALNQILEGLLQRKKQQYFADLRIKCINKREENLIKGFTVINNFGKSIRHYFMSWKYGSNERALAKEMHEEGPIREQAFEQRNALINLTSLMKEEGYDDKEILDALSEERTRQSHLMLKSVSRMQHYNEALYTKPKMFDKWRSYIHTRRLFKYWLTYAEKRSQFIKADLHQAFDTWKAYHPTQHKMLQRSNKRVLDRKMIVNNRQLEELAEEVHDKENQIGHLNDQREALLDNYIKAQRLALTLWRNHHKRSVHQAFLRWAKSAKSSKNSEKTAVLRKNIEFLESLKDKISNLENDNELLANENEELRQFSMDGYEIAKNVQSLTGEREKLSVDLADKAQMIRKLLDENERLTHKLRYAQDEAQSMIRSTMAGSSGFKTGQKGYPSPLTRSTGFY